MFTTTKVKSKKVLSVAELERDVTATQVGLWVRYVKVEGKRTKMCIIVSNDGKYAVVNYKTSKYYGIRASLEEAVELFNEVVRG